MLLAVVMVFSMLPTLVFAEDTATYTKITSAEELTTGKYVMVVSTGYGPGVLASGWLTAEAITVDGDTVTDPAATAVWDITVDGSTVKLTDSNGVSIAPKGGNNNGIQAGDYSWAVTCTDGTFQFAGQGEDTVILASNKGSENKFRAYKSATVTGNPNGYPSEFTLYKLGAVAPARESGLVTDLTTLQDGDTVVVFNPANAKALSTTYNGYYNNGVDVTFADGKLSGYTDAELWTLGINEDGTYTVAAAAGGFAAFNDGNSGQDNKNLTVSTATGITIEPVKDVFKIRGEFAYKTVRKSLDRYVAPVAYSVSPDVMTDYVKQVDSYLRSQDYITNHITANAVATWTPKLGDNHDLNVVAGWNLENNVYRRQGQMRTGILYPEKPNFELMDGQEIEMIDDGSEYGIVGVFARVNYSLLRRYIFEFSAREDGSSKFPSNQRWGFFPSGSIGWRLSEEPWMKATRGWLDNFKIRANAGALGNGTVAAYAFLTTMGMKKTTAVFDGTLQNKVSDPSVVPDNLTWEKVATYDIGLDADFLKSRLSFSGDYYVRNTTDLYINGPEIPATFGDSTPKGNYGALQTKGWELTLSWRDQFKMGGKDFTYSIKGSLWDSRTWVTKYYNQSGGMFNYYEGKELGEIWGFRTAGLFQSNEEAAAWPKDAFHNFVPVSGPYAGDVKFVDVNGDNTINTGSWTLDDHGDLERIGNEAPRYQFGLNLDFRWNGIGLSAFFQGVGKRDWYPSQGTDFFWGSYGRAYAYALKTQRSSHAILDKTTENWTLANASEDPYWPRQTYGTADSATGALTFPNDRYLQNAAYVRLKTLTLDYSLPKKVVEKAHLQQVRFYLTGENLWTWSPMFKHTRMFDPEVIGNGDSDFHSGTSTTMGDGYSYPLLRTFTFGVNITL